MNEERKVDSKQLKEIELRLIAELMKNSRRSDRELAKALGTQQPTVSRTIKRLEKEGIIKEYTMIPDFAKLGYTLLGITQIGVDQTDREYYTQAREVAARDYEEEKIHANILVVSGTGDNTNRAFVTFYKNYSDYAEAVKLVKGIAFSKADAVKTFLVDLKTELHYRSLTMSMIARDILQDIEKATSEGAKP